MSASDAVKKIRIPSLTVAARFPGPADSQHDQNPAQTHSDFSQLRMDFLGRDWAQERTAQAVNPGGQRHA